MAHVVKKNRSPYWIAKFSGPDGRVMWRTTKKTGKRDALTLAHEWEFAARQARSGTLTSDRARKVVSDILEKVNGERIDSRSVKDYFAEWTDSKATAATAKGGNAARAGTATLGRYKPVLTGFLKMIGPARAAASIGFVTASDIERYRNQELTEGKSHSTADYSHKILRGVFNTARRRGLIQSNPAEAVDFLNGECAEREPFTDAQLGALLAAADVEWRGMILFGAHAGLRLQDAANLTHGSIDRARGCLIYRARKTSHRKRSSVRETVVALHADLVRWLADVLPADAAAPLFPSLTGRVSGGGVEGSECGLSLGFTKVMKAAGITSSAAREALPAAEGKTKGRSVQRLGFHSLRHTFVTRLSRADVSADVRREMAGHGSDEIHRRYLHLDLGDQRAAMERLGSLLS